METIKNFAPPTDHLEFMFDRLVTKHHENPQSDYMIGFRKIIEKMRHNEKDRKERAA